MLLLFIGMTLLAALTPGLVVLLVTSNALKKGFGAAWRATVGIEIGNAVYVIASATGLTALLVASAPLFTAVRRNNCPHRIRLGDDFRSQRDRATSLYADPRVMQHMPKLLDHAESDASLKRIKENFAQHGFGLWAVELIGIADAIRVNELRSGILLIHPLSWLKWRNQSRALNPARAPNGSITWHKVRLVLQFLNHPRQ